MKTRIKTETMKIFFEYKKFYAHCCYSIWDNPAEGFQQEWEWEQEWDFAGRIVVDVVAGAAGEPLGKALSAAEEPLLVT